MEIKIINSNDCKSKCTLFNLVNPQPMFLDLTTDAGVSVSLNGDNTGKSMDEFIKSLVMPLNLKKLNGMQEKIFIIMGLVY